MGEWISVKEGMPENGVRVLSVQEDGIVRINSARCGEFGTIVNRECKFVRTTHWMPLPEPPKEE